MSCLCYQFDILGKGKEPQTSPTKGPRADKKGSKTHVSDKEKDDSSDRGGTPWLSHEVRHQSVSFMFVPPSATYNRVATHQGNQGKADVEMQAFRYACFRMRYSR